MGYREDCNFDIPQEVLLNDPTYEIQVDDGVDSADPYTQYKLRPYTDSKHWLATSPEGEEVFIYNLHQFCKEKGISSKKMYMVANGQRRKHKGWTNVICLTE